MNSFLGLVPLIVLCVLVYGNYRLVMWAKVKHPNSLKVGLLLCLLSPMGHLYLDDAGKWMIGLGLLAGFLKPFLGEAAFLVADAMSLLAFWYRFVSVQRAPKLA